MNNTSTLQERDVIVQHIIQTLMKKHKTDYRHASIIFAGMVSVVINDKDLELILNVAQKERN